MNELLIFSVGLLLLLDGANIFVKSAVSLAKNFRVPKTLLAGSILAIGTSLPELFVAISSSAIGDSALSLGNIIGSNIANIFFILGLALLIGGRIPVEFKENRLPANISFVVSLAFLGMVIRGYAGWHSLLLLGLAGYIIFRQARVAKDYPVKAYRKEYGNVFLLVMSALGLAGLIYGAHLLTTTSAEIATRFGVSDFVIGLILIAIGTSLPELATSLSAIRQKESGVALSGLIGSNIFNILLVGGAGGLFAPYTWDDDPYTAIMFILAAGAIWLFVHRYRGRSIPLQWGKALLIFYALYLAYLAQFEIHV